MAADVGEQAIAAASVVAASLPGGPPVDRHYGPDAATTAGLDLPPEVVPLAAQALRRVLGEQSK